MWYDVMWKCHPPVLWRGLSVPQVWHMQQFCRSQSGHEQECLCLAMQMVLLVLVSATDSASQVRPPPANNKHTAVLIQLFWQLCLRFYHSFHKWFYAKIHYKDATMHTGGNQEKDVWLQILEINSTQIKIIHNNDYVTIKIIIIINDRITNFTQRHQCLKF